MFYLKTMKKRKIQQNISLVFETSYEIKYKHKLSRKITADMYFPTKNVAVLFGEYDNTDKNIIELEKLEIKIFNIPLDEDIFKTLGRLLYVLR